MPSMNDERRQDERHVVLVKVALRDEERLRHLYATNLSKGGLFLATKSGLPIGQQVRLRLVHPLTGTTFEVTAEVVNVRRGKDGAVKGCGLKFSTFDEELKEELFMFVEGVVDLDESEGEIEIDVVPPEDAPERTPEVSPVKAQSHALFLKSLVLEKDGNLIGAAHLLARATAMDPKEDELWTALRRVEAKLEEAAQRAVESNLEPSAADEKPQMTAEPTQKEEAAGDGGDDVMELDELSALEPADRRKSRLLFEAARDCYRTQDVDDAINYLEHAIGADPGYPPPYYALAGMLAEERNEVERSLFLCRKAVELDPDNEVYQDALAGLEKNS